MAHKAMRNQGEFRRREEVAEAYKKNGGMAERPEIVTSIASVFNPAQQYVLYNIAHARALIASPDGTAWVRWLGIFPSKAEAQAHANAVIKRDPGLDTRYFPVGEFFGVRRDKYADVWADQVVLDTEGHAVLDAAGHAATRKVRAFFDEAGRMAEVKKVRRLLKRHAARRRKNLKEVRQNAMRRRMGDSSDTMEHRLAEDVDEGAAAAAAEAAAAKRSLDDEEAAAALRMDLVDVLAGLNPAASAKTGEVKPETEAKPKAAESIDALTAATAVAVEVAAKPEPKPKVVDEDAKVEEDEDDAPAPTPASAPASPVLVIADDTKPAETKVLASCAAFGAVRPIPRKLEVRMQKFLAMAVVDDFMTLDEHEAAVDAWCAVRDAAYTTAREALLWSVLEAHGCLRALDGTAVSFLAAEKADKAAASVSAAAVAAARAAAETAALTAGKTAVAAKAAADWAESTVGHVTAPCRAADATAAGLALADVLPPLHRLVRKWLEKNLPPPGYNVWGEYIGKEAADGSGYLKLRRDDVVAKKAAFKPGYAVDDDEELAAPKSDRQIKIWVQQRDMRVEQQTWKWSGHSHLPLRKEVLAAWYAVPGNAPPALDALPQEEPAVAAFQAFESEADAQRWVKSMEKVAELKDHDMCVVAMYEWVRLDDRHNENLPRNYRNEHVHDIMASRAEQAARARELEMEARTTKRKMNVVTVADNAVESAQVLPAGLTEAEFAAATASAKKADDEMAAEMAKMKAAEAAGKTYKSKKVREAKVVKADATLLEAGMASQADWDAAVARVKADTEAKVVEEVDEEMEEMEELAEVKPEVKSKVKSNKVKPAVASEAKPTVMSKAKEVRSAGDATTKTKAKETKEAKPVKTKKLDDLLGLDLSTFTTARR